MSTYRQFRVDDDDARLARHDVIAGDRLQQLTTSHTWPRCCCHGYHINTVSRQHRTISQIFRSFHLYSLLYSLQSDWITGASYLWVRCPYCHPANSVRASEINHWSRPLLIPVLIATTKSLTDLQLSSSTTHHLNGLLWPWPWTLTSNIKPGHQYALTVIPCMFRQDFSISSWDMVFTRFDLDDRLYPDLWLPESNQVISRGLVNTPCQFYQDWSSCSWDIIVTRSVRTNEWRDEQIESQKM